MRYIFRDEAIQADSSVLLPFLLAATSLLIGLSAGSPARAESSDEATLWKPSLALQVAIAVRNFDSDLSSTAIMGPPLPANPVEVDPRHGPPTVWFPASGSATSVTPVVSGVFEFMTPRMTKKAGAPRFFMSASIDSDQGSRRDLAKSGVPGELGFNPEAPPGQATFTETSIAGQGAVTSVEIKPSAYTVGLGVAFSMNVGDRLVRIKPSAEFSQFRVRYSSYTARVVDLNPAGDPSSFNDLREITLGAGDTELYNAIGPALEIEVDTYRYGDFTLGLYIKGAMQAILGNTSYDATATNQYGEEAFYDYEIERYGYRVGTGFRVSWVPE